MKCDLGSWLIMFTLSSKDSVFLMIFIPNVNSLDGSILYLFSCFMYYRCGMPFVSLLSIYRLNLPKCHALKVLSNSELVLTSTIIVPWLLNEFLFICMQIC